jgi:WD40 repeat protein
MSLPLIHQIVLNSSDGVESSTYILDMDTACDASAFAVASAGGDKNIVSVYDPNSGQCVLPALTGHKDVINSISFSHSCPSHLISASEDQTVCLFDCRTSTLPTAQIIVDGEVYSAAIGFDDTLIAIAIGSTVEFYDSRNLSTPLGSYADCHSDTVLQVKFHPLQSGILHSAGEDGLICSYDTGVAAEVGVICISVYSHDELFYCILSHVCVAITSAYAHLLYITLYHRINISMFHAFLGGCGSIHMQH